MYIGRIITTSKKIDVADFIEISTTYTFNPSIPTLIIGKKNAVAAFGADRIKVLDKQIEPNVYWTFSKTERRVDYDADLVAFKKIVEERMLSMEYSYYNIFIESGERTRQFIDWMYAGAEKYVYVSDDMLYFYSPETNLTGLSLNDIEYIGKDREEVIQKIKSNPNNFVFTKSDISYQKFGVRNELYYPYLAYLKKN